MPGFFHAGGGRMRYRGEISEWRDDRGFGFITPVGGGERVFVHISAFGRGRRPRLGDLVSFEVGPRGERGPRATNASFLRTGGTAPGTGVKRYLLHAATLSLFIAFAFFSYTRSERPRNSPPPAAVEGSAPGTAFTCQGKRTCGEMTSCEEARFYLENCRGVEIDGDGDGIPCESQWCGQ